MEPVVVGEIAVSWPEGYRPPLIWVGGELCEADMGDLLERSPGQIVRLKPNPVATRAYRLLWENT